MELLEGASFPTATFNNGEGNETYQAAKYMYYTKN